MNNVKRAPFKIKKEDFFAYWLALTQPLHKLTKTNVKVLTELLKIRQEYEPKILDKDLLDEYIFETKNRKRIMDNLDLPVERFNNIMSDMRKAGVIVDNKLNRAFVPNLTQDSKGYRIMFDLIFE